MPIACAIIALYNYTFERSCNAKMVQLKITVFASLHLSEVFAAIIYIGPAGYIVPTPVAPAPLIGEILFPLRPPDNPAPNQYSLPTSPCEGKTFGLKTQLSVRERGPPPNTYNHRQPRAQSVAHFTHRAFEWKCKYSFM